MLRAVLKGKRYGSGIDNTGHLTLTSPSGAEDILSAVFFSRLAYLPAPLVHHLALHGFMPLLMNADDPEQLAPSLKQLLSYHVAGVIITPVPLLFLWLRSILN